MLSGTVVMDTSRCLLTPGPFIGSFSFATSRGESRTVSGYSSCRINDQLSDIQLDRRRSFPYREVPFHFQSPYLVRFSCEIASRIFSDDDSAVRWETHRTLGQSNSIKRKYRKQYDQVTPVHREPVRNGHPHHSNGFSINYYLVKLK